MDALETIDFSLNSWTGPIPDFLGTLPNLTTLDLSNNDFSGTIPASIANNNNLITYISGNLKLSTSSKSNTNNPSSDTTIGIPNNDQQLYTTGANKKNKTGVIVGILGSVFLIAGIVAGVLAIKNHTKRKAEAVAEANNAGNTKLMFKVLMLMIGARSF
ncbi:receptor-like protein 19 isoform X2 [Impatiens glandulifera]|uniref:receptor-like protein 19 isoform X2 n=1 Tax=Impatiens glandulifera TaxID=253017 RepID=UPI001FB1084A|nr:receptor-like protein 19 isoform X2 [Impatiens glandulifera]